MKLGIFGGTFNPPHKGHIRLCKEFKDRLELDKVFIIPDKAPVHKTVSELESNEDRYNMCKLCFTEPEYEISRMELDRDEPSYSYLTVRELREKYPNDEFYLIIGSDMFLCFNRWKNYTELIENCTVCVASRDDEDTVEELKRFSKNELLRNTDRENSGVIISTIEPFEVSSTELREKIKTNTELSKFLTKETIEYIAKRGLYGYPKK